MSILFNYRNRKNKQEQFKQYKINRNDHKQAFTNLCKKYMLRHINFWKKC